MLHPPAIVVGSPLRVVTHPDENHTVVACLIPVLTHSLGHYPSGTENVTRLGGRTAIAGCNGTAVAGSRRAQLRSPRSPQASAPLVEISNETIGAYTCGCEASEKYIPLCTLSREEIAHISEFTTPRNTNACPVFLRDELGEYSEFF
jgi:hypothetical protein